MKRSLAGRILGLGVLSVLVMSSVAGCGEKKEDSAVGGKISPPQGKAGADTGSFGKIDLTNPGDKK